jgi:hypothetical protein
VTARTRSKRKKTAARTVEPVRPGLPAADSVRGVGRLRSPRGRVYRILKTTETDAYDPTPGRKKRDA